ncbi:hypothetical protein [Streptomyces sp. ODS28]|uniref:hypothetical protein n=1 Tax=Streptomyces sp. ODS28 TaxID=3136688 RepID=UPI0031EB859E
MAVFLGTLTPVYVTVGVTNIAKSLDLPAVAESAQKFQQGFDYIATGEMRYITLEGVLAILVFFSVMIAEARWYLLYILPNPFPRTFVHQCAHAINACASAHSATSSFSKRTQLRRVDRACRSVEKHILRIHYSSLSIATRSPRRVAVRKHAAAVVGAIHAQMTLIDIEGDRALRELAQMLLTISERYSKGHLGDLLPDEFSLRDVTPVSTSRSAILESIHVMATLMVGLGAAVGMSVVAPSLHVPKDMQPWAALFAGVCAAISVSGWRKVTRILEAFPGK